MSGFGSILGEFLDNVFSFDYTSKNHIFIIQSWGFYCCNIKLRSVCVFFPAIGHCKDIGLIMFVDMILIFKGITIYRLPTRSIFLCNISSLYEKIRDNSMKANVLIMQIFPTFTNTFLTRA